jgi:anti-anti-sigma regulatory factor
MSGFSIKQVNQAEAPGTITVVLSGEMTIQNAGEIRNALMQAFSAGEGLILDMNKVSAVDLAGLQLMCAAHRTSIAEEKHFSVSGIYNEAIKSVIMDAGFPRRSGCVEDIDNTCVWTGGDKQWQKL